MSKTAEEILRQELNLAAVKHGEDPVLNEDWDDWKEEQGPEFMKAMWSSYSQFAAQEVYAYRERLKSAVNHVIMNERKADYLTGRHIYELIDTVK